MKLKVLCIFSLCLCIIRQANRETYCIDWSQGKGEVEVVAVVDISVSHELQILISHNLHKHTNKAVRQPWMFKAILSDYYNSCLAHVKADFALPDRCWRAFSLQTGPSSLPCGPDGWGEWDGHCWLLGGVERTVGKHQEKMEQTWE